MAKIVKNNFAEQKHVSTCARSLQTGVINVSCPFGSCHFLYLTD
jgi:hypothetical protein